MLTRPTLDEGEVEMIVMALRFWRAQRTSGVTRRTDSFFISPDDVDFLLAKLQPSNLTTAVNRVRPGRSIDATR
jgi:hypothetical protein